MFSLAQAQSSTANSLLPKAASSGMAQTTIPVPATGSILANGKPSASFSKTVLSVTTTNFQGFILIAAGAAMAA